MGWFSSSSSDAKPASEQLPTPTSPPAHLQPEPLPQLPTQSQPPSQSVVDPDAAFHAAFPHLAPTSSTSLTQDAHATLNPNQTSSTSDLSSYPTHMSCRAAFDSAFYCSSLGGHFNDIYRYGQLRACSEHWADWRFCMGLKSKSREKAEEAVQDRYRDKEEQIRARQNSEDVWRRREEGERIVGAFVSVEEEGP